VNSPITHSVFVDLSFENDGSGRQHGRVERNATEPNFTLTRRILESFEEPAVAVEDLGAAAPHGRLDVVGLHEAFKRALEVFGREARPQ
jgi:hypothetical protein